MTEPGQESDWYLALYDVLHGLASRYFRRESPGHTLQPTALINEAYVRLARYEGPGWRDREHFLAAAAKAMRQVLIDHARRKHALKRGGGGEPQRIELNELEPTGHDLTESHELELIQLDEALKSMESAYTRPREVVELRFFAGLSVEETASVLRVSPSTVKADWQFAKAWLKRELG